MRTTSHRASPWSGFGALLGVTVFLTSMGCPPPGATIPPPPPDVTLATCAETCTDQRAQLGAAMQRLAGLSNLLWTWEKGPNGKPHRVASENPQVLVDYNAALKEVGRLRALLADCTSQYAPDVVTIPCTGQATLVSANPSIGTVSGGFSCRMTFGPSCHSSVTFECDPALLPVDPSRAPSGVVLGSIAVSLQGPAEAGLRNGPDGTVDVNRILTLDAILKTVTPVTIAGVSTTDMENLTLRFISAPIANGSGSIILASNRATFSGGFLGGSTATVAAALQCNPPVP